jgi:hypothetical protein
MRGIAARRKQSGYVFQLYPSDWRTGEPRVVGPEGDVPELPEGARFVTVTYTQEWRQSKPQQWASVRVYVDLTDAAVLPRPVPLEHCDDGSFVPVPEIVRAPDAWVIAKPTGAEMARYAAGQAFLWGQGKRDATMEQAHDMVVPLCGGKLPGDVIVLGDPYATKELALSAALEKLGELYAAYVDARD